MRRAASFGKRTASSERIPRRLVDRDKNANNRLIHFRFTELRAASATSSRKQDTPCDLQIDTPTLIIKPDSCRTCRLMTARVSRAVLGYNMYHHFCDFLNVYLTQHLNGSFSRDVRLLFWDTVITTVCYIENIAKID